MDVTKVDKNFDVEMVGDAELRFIPYDTPPLRLHGIVVDDGKLLRVPRSVAEATGERVVGTNTLTSGGRIRLRTDSSVIAVRYTVSWRWLKPHMTPLGSFGFDIYADGGEGDRFCGSLMPPLDNPEVYLCSLKLGSKKMRTLTIDLPLYNPVLTLDIGIDADAELLPPEDYAHKTPVLYYGSSITQGGCASRPGMSYEAMLSRRLGTDFVNLGFSGSAMGEEAIVDYIAGQEMSAFVLDYDHNAPTVEHLRATHYRLYERVRRAHPDIYIIMLSRPKFYLSAEEQRRRDVVRETYERALAAGDGRVRFIDGGSIFPPDVCDDATVDRCHPTDLGFYFMANAIEPHLAEAIDAYENRR